LQEHINTFITFNQDARYVIAYNKVDLLTVAQKESLYSNLSGDVFLTSAKENNNVDKLFTTLTKEILL